MSETASTVRIREAMTSEHAICAHILSRAWNSTSPSRSRPVGIRDFREQTFGELLLVTTSKGDPLGFISVWRPSWFVHHLFVHPMSQRRGIGRRLLGYVSTLAAGHPLSLKCQTENCAAIRFYERYGFQQTDSRGSDEFGEWVELRIPSAQPSCIPPSGQRMPPNKPLNAGPLGGEGGCTANLRTDQTKGWSSRHSPKVQVSRNRHDD